MQSGKSSATLTAMQRPSVCKYLDHKIKRYKVEMIYRPDHALPHAEPPKAVPCRVRSMNPILALLLDRTHLANHVTHM